MKLVDDWKLIIRKAWSIRVAVGSAAALGILSGLVMIWPALENYLNVWVFSLGGIFVSVAFFVTRLIQQVKDEDDE